MTNPNQTFPAATQSYETLGNMSRAAHVKMNAMIDEAVALSEATGFDTTAKAVGKRLADIAATTAEQAKQHRDVIAILKGQKDFPDQQMDTELFKRLDAQASLCERIDRAQDSSPYIQSIIDECAWNLSDSISNPAVRESLVAAVREHAKGLIRDTLMPSKPSATNQKDFIASLASGRNDEPSPLVHAVSAAQGVSIALSKLAVAKIDDEITAAVRQAAGLSRTTAD